MLYLDFNPSMLTEQFVQELEDARNELDPYARLPEEYTVELRRHALVETIHYSTRIEGNTLTLEQVQSLLAGEKQMLQKTKYKRSKTIGRLFHTFTHW